MAKRCKHCKKLFEPTYNSLQACCTPTCAILWANTDKGKAHKEKAVKRETRQRKQNLKTKADWAREAQQAVNAYIRARDKGKPCISCDKPDDGTHQRHASHFRSVGSCSGLRFNLFNIHASCQQCNTTKSGNIGMYRPRLISKIGLDRVEWIEGQNSLIRYDIEYLKKVKCHIDGCDRDAQYKERQLCQMHYFRHMRNGHYGLKGWRSPTTPKPRKAR